MTQGSGQGGPPGGGEDVVELVELDDLDDDDFPLPPRPGSSILALAFSPPALAIAGLLTAVVSMGQVQSGTEIADTHFESTNPTHLTTLSVYRISTGVRLGVAVVALVIAVVAAVRLRNAQIEAFLDQSGAEDEEDVETPLWVRAVVGASVVLGVLAVALAGMAFGYAMAGHATSTFTPGLG